MTLGDFLKFEEDLIRLTRDFSKQNNYSLEIKDYPNGITDLNIGNTTNRNFVQVVYSERSFFKPGGISIKGLQNFERVKGEYISYLIDKLPGIKSSIENLNS